MVGTTALKYVVLWHLEVVCLVRRPRHHSLQTMARVPALATLTLYGESGK